MILIAATVVTCLAVGFTVSLARTAGHADQSEERRRGC